MTLHTYEEVSCPLPYHDMEIGYLAWYFPCASVGDGTILNSVDPDGHIKGIELYPECEYATAVHYVFDMDELVRYIKFRDVLAEEVKRARHSSVNSSVP